LNIGIGFEFRISSFEYFNGRFLFFSFSRYIADRQQVLRCEPFAPGSAGGVE